jgi:hypothetical protein
LLHFGKNLGRGGPAGPGGSGLGQKLADDPSLMQLLPLAALRAEAAGIGLAAHRSEAGAQIRAFIGHAVMLCEVARRTGEIETLTTAASAAVRARELARRDRRCMASALIAHAEVLSQGALLFTDDETAQSARERLNEARSFTLDPVQRTRVETLDAGLLARVSLKAGDPKDEQATAALAAAAQALGALADAGKLDRSEAHEAACDRVELLIGAGLRGKDRGRLDAALSALAGLAPPLDAAYRPLTWARAETLRGQALAALGDLTGETAVIGEGAAVLAAVAQEIPIGHSPLIAARANHALGLALQALGEAGDDEALFDRAIAAFSGALEAVDDQPLLPLRAIVAHDGAACLARRAERRGDLASLERAEAAFRDALKNRSAAADPLSWAVTQVALARIYEAEADLRGDTGERADAAFALASALEVFAERGLRSLSDMTLTALERVKSYSPSHPRDA